MKQFIFYITYYIPDILCGLFHEFSHWTIFLIGWILRCNSFPIIYVDRLPQRTVNKDLSTNTKTSYMYVDIEMYNNSFLTNLIFFYAVIAPALFTIILYLISPWYMWLLYTPYLDRLWMSESDINSLTN